MYLTYLWIYLIPCFAFTLQGDKLEMPPVPRGDSRNGSG